MASLENRLADTEYKNWVKTQLCLLYVKKGLTGFADVKSQELQKNVLANIALSGNSILTEMDKHKTDPNIRLNLKNSDRTKLSTEHWQIAKCYMNPGQETTNKVPDETDISGLLNFISNCTEPAACISDMQKVKTVRDNRNTIMHTKDMKVNPADFLRYIQCMIDLLEDPGFPNNSPVCLKNDLKANEAVAKIKEIQAANFIITKDDEMKAFTDLRDDIQKYAEGISSEMNDLKITVSKLSKHDIQADKVIKGMEEKINKKEQEMKKVQASVEWMETTLKAYKDQPELLHTFIKSLSKTQAVRTDVEKLRQGVQEQGSSPTESGWRSVFGSYRMWLSLPGFMSIINRWTTVISVIIAGLIVYLKYSKQGNLSSRKESEDDGDETTHDTSPDDIRKRVALAKLYAEIKEEMERETALSVARDMHRHCEGVLSSDELESIVSCRTRRERVEQLLKRVLMGRDKIFDIFIECLKRQDNTAQISEKLQNLVPNDKEIEVFTALEASSIQLCTRPDAREPRFKLTETNFQLLLYELTHRPELLDAINDYFLSSFDFSIREHTNIVHCSLAKEEKAKLLLETMKLCSDKIYQTFFEILRSRKMEKVVKQLEINCQTLEERQPAPVQILPENAVSNLGNQTIVASIQNHSTELKKVAEEDLRFCVKSINEGSIVIELKPLSDESWKVLENKCLTGKIKDFIPKVFKNEAIRELMKDGEYKLRFTIYTLTADSPPGHCKEEGEKMALFYLETDQGAESTASTKNQILGQMDLLCEELEFTEDFLKVLKRFGFVEEDIETEIKMQGSRAKRNEFILTKLSQHGPEGYEVLKSHIKDIHQNLYKDLTIREDVKAIDMLGKSEKVGESRRSHHHKQVFFTGIAVLEVTTKYDPTGKKENFDPSVVEREWDITCPEILEPVCHFKKEDPKGKKENFDPSVVEREWDITCPEILEPVCHFKKEETLLSSYSQMADEELNRLAAHLKEGYAENDKFYIPLLPGCIKIPVGEIFAPVILTKNDAGEEQPVSSYKAMLCQEVPKKQLFLVGEAGAGKSTFCKHLVDVWRSESTSSQFENPEELRNFKFVFHVSCRFAKETDSVLDMICEQLCYNQSMKKIAIHVLSHSPEACFIIMDGLDEWQGHPGKSTGLLCDTTGLPSRKGVEDCLILTTSRPWRLQALVKEIEPKARFELAGLQSAEELIKNILLKMKYPDPAISCANFLRQVNMCGMNKMIETPLILIIVLSIWKQSSDSEQNRYLHPSLCRNYINMVESLILRATNEKHWTGNETRLLTPLVNELDTLKTKWVEKSVSLPSCCQELESFTTFSGLIVSLSELAFNLLFGETTSDEQKLVFSKQDCKKYLSEEELNVCLGIGILSKSQTYRGIEKLESYSFPHKTVQEFLSALWLAGPGADRVGRITERFSEETGSYSWYRAVNNVEMLLKFLSGLGPQVAAEPLQYIYTQCIKYSRTSRINELILSCCAESQHCNNTKHIYFTFPEIKLLGETMSDDNIRMLANIVEASSSCLRRLYIVGLTLRHESVEEPSDISSCHSSIDTLYQSLSCCGNLEELWLVKISCSDDRHDNISSVLDLHNLHKLRKLTLWKLSVRTVLWPPVTNSCLRRLVIVNLKLTHESVEEPSNISSCHSSIDTLYQSLSCCGNLEELWLWNISCSDDRHDNISSVLDIHNLHKLEELSLWGLSVRTVLWPPVTNSCLRWLYIRDLKLTHECVEELCRTYEQCRQLEREYCEVSDIFCVDHRTDCDSFEDLQKHIMLVNLPYFDDDDNDDVDSDDFDYSDSDHSLYYDSSDNDDVDSDN